MDPDAAAASLAPAALAGLGLTDQPFTDATRESLYLDAVFEAQIERLLHHLTYSDRALALCGPPGSGRSSLLLALLKLLPGKFELFIARGQHGLSADRVLRDMLGTFRRPVPAETTAVREELIESLDESLRRDVPAALVVDDADAMDPDQLAALIEQVDDLNTRLSGRLRLMLVGTDELDQTLRLVSSPTREEDRHFRSDVPPMTPRQAQAFLIHRLRRAGAVGDPPLTPKQWDSVYARSGGYAGALQHAMAEQLNRHYVRRPERAAAATRRLHWLVIGAAALVAVAAGLGLWLGDSAPEGDRQSRDLALPAAPSPAIPPGAAPRQSPAGLQTPASPRVLPAAETPAAPGSPAPTVAATPDQPDARPAPPPGGETPVARPDSRVTALPAPQSLTPEPAGVRTGPALAEVDARVEEKGGRTATGPGPTTAPVDPPPAAAPAVAAGAEPPGRGRADELLDEAWLRQQPAASFTVQVLALGDAEGILAFARANGLNRDTPAAWFRTRHRGADWFVLVTGRYPDKAAARAAIARLPRAISRNQPWIRSLASIQQAIDGER